VRPVAVALLAMVCAQGCATHQRPDAAASGYLSKAQSLGATIEAQDPRLGAALLRVQLVPSAASHRAAADEYRRLGILDTAFDHLTEATRLNPRDACVRCARAHLA